MSKSAPLAFIMPIIGALFGMPSGTGGTGTTADIAYHTPGIVSHQISLTGTGRRRILRYWTPERMLHALDRTLVTSPLCLSCAPLPRIQAPRRQTARTAPNPGALWTAPGTVRTTIGKVFFTIGGHDYVCSAGTVTSASRDLIVTAGHCAKNDASTWTQNWIFVPGYDQGMGRYGEFTARRMFVSRAWSEKADENEDVAMVALSTGNGRHIADVTGAQGITFNQPRGTEVYSFGYPSFGRYDGERLAYCSGTTHDDAHKLTRDLGLRCDMTEGASGGPWLARYDPASGTGVVTSVNTFKYSDDPNTMYGPYFGDTVRRLYEDAQRA